MNSNSVKRHKARVDAIFLKTSSISVDDSQARSEWSKYLCIVVAGFVEKSIVNLLSDLINSKSSGPFRDFMLFHTSKIQNPKASRICEILGTLKAEWSSELSAFMEDDGRKDAIDTIMINRHLIAHGRGEDAQSLTVARMQAYYAKSLEVIEKLEEILSR